MCIYYICQTHTHTTLHLYSRQVAYVDVNIRRKSQKSVVFCWNWRPLLQQLPANHSAILSALGQQDGYKIDPFFPRGSVAYLVEGVALGLAVVVVVYGRRGWSDLVV